MKRWLDRLWTLLEEWAAQACPTCGGLCLLPGPVPEAQHVYAPCPACKGMGRRPEKAAGE
ncbi:hypothetical protein K7W42_19285 [Deinococcus sp. HMF7604]|uniref:hypothetical protein n=1 Tax=Deinococcus betulae TaxID=2873312 RepID=UPI001CCD9112|nr:hypothetical protein [Deinococcus betulae]MBZ9752985.1 hypothetical protein [Deinococcus betulae]